MRTKKRPRSVIEYPVAGIFILAAVCLFVFRDITGFSFICFDDQAYVWNPIAQSGLGPENIIRAFTAVEAGFWQPLTWMSLALDNVIYGNNPGGYHLTNLLLHLMSTVMLFLALKRMTGSEGRSFFVACIFSIHPLHVEPVAWVASRKDVLSAFFMMSALWAYSYYAVSGRISQYACALAAFICGLMSKPMLVTFPFVLLLLDYWPLGRVSPAEIRLRGVLLEKVPFLALSIIFTALAFYAEKKEGAFLSMAPLSLGQRLKNAVVSYAGYIEKTIWPENLAVLYPHPGSWGAQTVMVSLLLLALITVVVTIFIKSRPYLLVGWLWFLGMLVPVIGLVQIGSHAMADRYMYLPMIGLLIMGAWMVSDIASYFRFNRQVLTMLVVICMAGYGTASRFQLEYWSNSITLFKRTLAVTDNNLLAHSCLGLGYLQAGRPDEAIEQLQNALAKKPDFTEVAHLLKIAYQMKSEGIGSGQAGGLLALPPEQNPHR